MMNFQHHYSSFQCRIIFQKSKSTDLMLNIYFLLLSLLKTVVLLNILHKLWFFFPGLFDEQKVKKKKNIYLKFKSIVAS